MSPDFLSSILLDGLMAAIAATGFAVISNPPKRAIAVSALLAASQTLSAAEGHSQTARVLAEQTAAAGGNAAAQPRPADPLERIRRDVEADPAFGAHALKNWLQDRG